MLWQMDTKELIEAYLAAAGSQDFVRLGQLVHPDATFDGTVQAQASGAAAYVNGFRNLAPIYERYEVRQVIVEGDNAAVLYEFVTDTAAGNVLSAEFLTTDGKQITGSTLIFDWRRWPEVIAELKSRRERIPAN